MHPEIPLHISILFLATVVVVFVYIIYILKQALIGIQYRNITMYVILVFLLTTWILLLIMITQHNILNRFTVVPPPMMLVVLIPIIASLIFIGTGSYRKAISAIPFQHLIYIQTFRVGIEFILWMLYRAGLVPVQMTFEGYNFDILTGLSALYTGYYYVHGYNFFRNKWTLVLWNIAGLFLLITIMTIAVLSTPLPFRYFMNEPANVIVFYFPFVLLPGFLVPVAFLAHLVALKKLVLNQF